MILDINNNFYFDLDTSVLFFDIDEYNQLDEKNRQYVKEILMKKRDTFHSDKRTIKTINLIPSMNCDGKCLYCYNKDTNNTICQDLTVDKLENVMKNLESKYNLDLESIRMYGGEPLKNKDLESIINFFLDYNKDMIFYISSGLFITEKLYQRQLNMLKKLIKTAKISIGVGIDLGTYPETRKCSYINKKQLLNRCDDLINIGLDIIFVNTVTKYTDTNKLFEEIFELKNKYKDIANEPKFRIAIACDDNYSPSLSQLDELYETLKEIYIKNKDNNITSNLYPYLDVIYTPNIYKLTDNMFLFQFSPFYCGLFSEMITVLSNGELSHCHMNITDHIIELNEYEQKEDFLYNKECLNCDYFMVCRGGCFYRYNVMKNNLENNKNIYCEWVKKSYNLSMYKLLNKIK